METKGGSGCGLGKKREGDIELDLNDPLIKGGYGWSEARLGLNDCDISYRMCHMAPFCIAWL